MTLPTRASLCLLLLLAHTSLATAAPKTVLPAERQPVVGIGVSPIIVDYTFTNQQKSSTTLIDIESAIAHDYEVTPVATDLVQNEDGTLLPAHAGSHPSSCAPWLKFDQTPMALPARGKIQFAITLEKTSRVTGTHLCGVQLFAVPKDILSKTKDKPTTLPGEATLNFNYTVVIKLSMPGQAGPPKLGFEKAVLVGEPPYPSVDVVLRNISDSGFPLSLSAELRQRENGNTIRVPMLIQRGHDLVATHTLWPDGSAHAIGRVPMPIPAGAYTLTLRATANRRVLQHTTEVTVPVSDSAELAWHDPIPNVIMKPGQRQTITFNLYNLSETTLSPVIKANPLHRELCRDWTYDISPLEGVMNPHGYRRVQVIFTASNEESSTCALTIAATYGKRSVKTTVTASMPLSTKPPVVTLSKTDYDPTENALTLSLANPSDLPSVFTSWTAFVTQGERRIPVGHWSLTNPRPVIPGVLSPWRIPLPTRLTQGVYTVRMMGFWKERTIILGEQEFIVSGADPARETPARTR